MSRLTKLLRHYTTAQAVNNHLCSAFITANHYFPKPFKEKLDEYCHEWQDYFFQDPTNKDWHYCDICALGQNLNQINQLLKEIQSCTSNN